MHITHEQSLRLALYDDALRAVMVDDIGPTEIAAIQRFIDDTPYEDEWLIRGNKFINGSQAMLMRSILHEQGTEGQKMMELHFSAVRVSMKALVRDNRGIPRRLLDATRLNIDFYKRVAMRQIGVQPAVDIAQE